MGFGLSISLFFIVGVFYVVIIDFYTMLFRITGLTQEKARFQVISLLTNSGYSTKESELVVEVLPRRRIARTIMLFGYVFSITIVSVFVNALVALPNSEKEEVWIPLIVICSLFVIFLLVKRIPVVQEAFSALLEQLGRKWLYGNQGNPILLQEEFPRGVIASVTLNKMPPNLEGKTLSQLNLEGNHGLKVVYVRRNNYMDLDFSPSSQFELLDEVVVYGDMKQIKEVFGYHGPVTSDNVKEAPGPESEAEFIHQQDVANARREAQKVLKEQAAKKTGDKDASPSVPEKQRTEKKQDKKPASSSDREEQEKNPVEDTADKKPASSPETSAPDTEVQEKKTDDDAPDKKPEASPDTEDQEKEPE